jgi:hypothetical protein
MNPATQYERLTSLRSDKSFDVAASEAAILSLFETHPVTKITTEGNHIFFVRRHFARDAARDITYRVFADETSAMVGEDAIGYCQLRSPAYGIVTIADAEVRAPFQKRGIATAVYDCIVRDMERVGVLLWPVAPEKMTDAEFKVWWRRSPALVFYYPHRERLGLEPRREFEALLNEELAWGPARGSLGSSGFWKKLMGMRRWLGSRFAPSRDDE